MKIVNTSRYTDAAVHTLVKLVARELEVSDYVDLVEVKNARGTAYFRGRCWGRRVLLTIGPQDKFPVSERQYRENAPTYTMEDWKEALVALTGHEFWHAREYRAQRALNVRRRHSEVACERSALAMLTVFRELRPALEIEIARKALKESEVEFARAAKAESARAPATRRGKKLEAARAALKKWEAKRKRAETAIKKYGKIVRRLEKESGPEARNKLTLGEDGNVFHVTGTVVEIERITQ